MMATLMENSLKLSYDMIFDNGSSWQHDESTATGQEQTVSAEEMNQKLQQRDSEWQERMEKQTTRAKAEGFERGFAEGWEEAKKETSKQVAGIEEIVQATSREFDQAMEDLKPHMAGLVFDLTEKILDIPVEHDALQRRVHQEITALVESLDEDFKIKVSLCPQDFDIIEEAFENNNKANRITFRVDNSLNSGEYAIETKKEYIVKEFTQMLSDFKESISFTDIETLNIPS